MRPLIPLHICPARLMPVTSCAMLSPRTPSGLGNLSSSSRRSSLRYKQQQLQEEGVARSPRESGVADEDLSE